MARYSFERIDSFRDREDELAAIDRWFENDMPHALLIHGRRRVGKSWLFRAFAHEKDADIFVATTRALGDQLGGFATLLGAETGIRPDLPDLESFFRALYRRAQERRRLAVIDELPNLLRVDSSLASTLLKVMEEEAGQSRLKLIVTGSHVSMMEGLLAEKQPLHGRLQALRLRPLDFWRARSILGEATAERVLIAYGLAGGMPKYLSELADANDPVDRLARLALSPYGHLFTEARAVLSQELQSPATYFSILAALAPSPADYATIAARSRVDYNIITKYLATLESLDLVKPRFPVTDRQRRGHARLYVLADGFLRFWFRFVFPFESDLEAGLDPALVIRQEIRPSLSDHLAPTIEEIAREWVRRSGLGGATHVGAWWGPAVNAFRRDGTRTSEEIDIVGLSRNRAVVVGEVRWRSEPMHQGILDELSRFKLPALAQAGVAISKPMIVLVSRVGFSAGLVEAARRDEKLVLVDPGRLVADPASAA